MEKMNLIICCVSYDKRFFKRCWAYFKAPWKQQLANDYEVSVRTITKWMKLANVNFSGILCPAQLREFYEKIGAPMVDKREVA